MPTAYEIRPLQTHDPKRFERPDILKALNSASRQLAELKGVAASIPNQSILINTLGIQEAKDSSAIENIVTTQDELYKQDSFPEQVRNLAAKEVHRYRQALTRGFDRVAELQLIMTRQLIEIQSELLQSQVGLRRMPGTNLVNSRGEVVYSPPQGFDTIQKHMADLEVFINMDEAFAADPIIKMALVHHQFESIHPFYDGNGRTGRILNVLYLVKEGLLNAPILYLSRALVRTKGDYYAKLQAVRDQDAWEDWVLYMVNAVEESARETVRTVELIWKAQLSMKHRIRERRPRIYSQELLNNLFFHPYTKIEFIMRDLVVSRLTATRYLDALTADGFLQKSKLGRSNYYVNIELMGILMGIEAPGYGNDSPNPEQRT